MNTKFSIRPLSRAIGLEVTGLDLSKPLMPKVVAGLQELLDRHALLYFPQQPLSIDQQIGFTSYFGEVCDENLSGRYHGYVSNRRPDSGVNADSALLWHSDNMWSAYPTLYIVLSGTEVVGDLAPTRFASNVRACRALDEELRGRVQALRTINLSNLAPGEQVGDVARSAIPVPPTRVVRKILPADDFHYPRTAYPVIWRHPRTGDEVLTVEEDFSAQIEGLPAEESERLYRQLFAIVYDERFVYDHHWQQDDLVIWDNLALQHGRPDFHGVPGIRTLARTSVQPLHHKYLETAPRVRELCEITNAARIAN